MFIRCLVKQKCTLLLIIFNAYIQESINKYSKGYKRKYTAWDKHKQIQKGVLKFIIVI